MNEFLLAFTAIFVALDIVGGIPIYISLTRSLDKAEKTKTANTSMAVAFIVALIFTFVGSAIFRHLGITLFDFRIAGGIILLLIALSDLHSGPDGAKKTSGSTGIVPIAVPLITGPGVLTCMVLQVGQHGYWMSVAALAANYLIAWVLLRNSDTVQRIVGKDGTVVLSKIAALLLAAIAVSMIRSGVVEAITLIK